MIFSLVIIMSEEYEITRYLNSKQWEEKRNRKQYNKLKSYGKEKYTGMQVGGKHYWSYEDGKWFEIKKSPDEWKITFNCIKQRYNKAPAKSGARVGTKYHWYIIADQIAEKLDANSYMTTMKGVKYKIGHQRPYWKSFSYEYPEQDSYKQKVIDVLERTLAQLKGDPNEFKK